MIRKLGVGLVVAAYAALLYTSLAAPAYAQGASASGRGNARRICWSVAGGAGLFAKHDGYDAGAHSHPPRRTLGNLDVARHADDPAGHADGLRSPLPGRARSAPARLPHLHDRGVPRRDRAAARPL